MSWSLKLGRPFGIPLYVHWTFLIIIAWIVYGHYLQGHDLNTTIEGVGFVLSIFACVVLHELGHALMARRYGVQTSDITLLPIGGVARLQRIPEKPAQELAIALAGPAVNLVIVLLLLALGVRPLLSSGQADSLLSGGFLQKLLKANIFLAFFNLLPAFPMDGGRVLRAGLALLMDYPKATRLAASVGQMMAIVFAFSGMTGGNPFLLLIALFVWLGAEAEARQVQERFLLRGVPLRTAMLTEFRTLEPHDTLGRAAELLLAGTQQDFPVLVEGQPTGVLTRAALLGGLSHGGPDQTISQVELGELGRVDVNEPLVPAVNRLRDKGTPCLLVMENESPVGLLTLENVAELVMVRTALAEIHAPIASTAST